MIMVVMLKYRALQYAMSAQIKKPCALNFRDSTYGVPENFVVVLLHNTLPNNFTTASCSAEQDPVVVLLLNLT